jgi:hypothetical protein
MSYTPAMLTALTALFNVPQRMMGLFSALASLPMMHTWCQDRLMQPLRYGAKNTTRRAEKIIIGFNINLSGSPTDAISQILSKTLSCEFTNRVFVMASFSINELLLDLYIALGL